MSITGLGAAPPYPMCFRASRRLRPDKTASCAATKARTQSGSVRAYCRNAQPIAFRMKNSEPYAVPSTFASIASVSRCTSVRSRNGNWQMIATRRSHMSSATAHAGGAPTALPVSGLSTTGIVAPSGSAYIYTVTVAAPYTNSSGSEVFFGGGVAWTGAKALPIGTEVSTSESGPVTVDSDGTCYYNAY